MTDNSEVQTDAVNMAAPVVIPARGFRWLLIGLLSPWLLVLVVAILVSAGGRESFTNGEVSLDATSRTIEGQRGPWGQMIYTRIAIEPPSDLIRLDDVMKVPLRWFFGGYTKAAVADLFLAAELPEDTINTLMASSREDGDGVTFAPAQETVLGLSTNARQMIYFTLAQFPENVAQRTAFSMRPAYVEERFAASGLRPEVIELVRGLLYPHGELLLFADVNVVLPRLQSDEERLRLVKTLSRKNTLLATLRVTPDMNLDRLIDYWSSGVRAKDVRPLIESLARIPDGSTVDVIHLLPQFARRRLYAYPRVESDPAAARRDCHWTSLNFFNATPNDDFGNPDIALEYIRSSFYFIAAQPRLGDVLLLALPDGKIIHTAIYVADDVVFTKNGAMFTQPWLLMPLDDLVGYYSAFHPPDQPLQVLYCRRRAE